MHAELCSEDPEDAPEWADHSEEEPSVFEIERVDIGVVFDPPTSRLIVYLRQHGAGAMRFAALGLAVLAGLVAPHWILQPDAGNGLRILVAAGSCVLVFSIGWLLSRAWNKTKDPRKG